MNINHKCVKKEVVICLVFLCKTLDINEIFFLTSWYAAVKSDLNPCGVSTQPTHSSASLRRRKMPNLHLWVGWKETDISSTQDRYIYHHCCIILNALNGSHKQKKICPMFQRACMLYSLPTPQRGTLQTRSITTKP